MTLWLGGVDDSISEIDIRDQVYAYGWIVSIHISRAGNCAFVEFANREMAENAARYLFKALTIRGKSIAVNWSKGRVGSMTSSGDAGTGHGEETASVMLPPPGMERAPVSDYSILAHTSNSSSSGSGGIIGQATEATNEDAVTGDEENAIGVGEKRPASEQLHKLPRPPVYPSTDPMRLGKS